MVRGRGECGEVGWVMGVVVMRAKECLCRGGGEEVNPECGDGMLRTWVMGRRGISILGTTLQQRYTWLHRTGEGTYSMDICLHHLARE